MMDKLDRKRVRERHVDLGQFTPRSNQKDYAEFFVLLTLTLSSRLLIQSESYRITKTVGLCVTQHSFVSFMNTANSTLKQT